MNRGRNLGLAVIMSSGIAYSMAATAPVAVAAAPAGSAAPASVQLQKTAGGDDYASGYRDGHERGVANGIEDAKIDCKKNWPGHVNSLRSGDYDRGYQDGYKSGFDTGYAQGEKKYCHITDTKKSGDVKKSDSGHGKSENGKKDDGH